LFVSATFAAAYLGPVAVILAVAFAALALADQGFARWTTRSSRALALCFVFGLPTSAAWGTTIQFSTPAGATIGGEPVSAKATFMTSANTIAVKLENLQADPSSVKAVIYDVMFSLSTGQNAGTITSTMGVERTVNDDGTFSDSGPMNLVDWG